ncbi:MAG: alpha/beta hydrolase, partial [Armatimonadetes bacterium]|nr:alpha/beta hydrolase [Armatimonadota bacterium]
MQPLPTLRYGGDDRQRILCAVPKAPRGVVVFVHGGGWTEGAPEELASLAHWLASVGWAVACPGYRLAPGSPWPAALDDVLAALSLLRRELPTGPWLLGGHSAGAQLALMAALTGDVGALAGLFGLSGVYHLRLAARTTWMRQRWIVPAFGDDGPAWDAASPLEQVRGGLPPTWLASAAVDWGLGRQTDLLAERLRAE